MTILIEKSNRLIESVSLEFQRDIAENIKWDWRLISLIGARGVGKTTLLLQHMKQVYGLSEQAIYVSLDDIYFTDNRLVDFVDDFYKKGGKVVYLDEVHKYKWADRVNQKHKSKA